ncbi:hypothetical protein ABIC28_002998 [Rhodococcus sp. PvR044]|uniref:hypothetical protein n=1 Tax=Rhodococcus sp. PvR044 TaxID=3156402 RepID=UPI0033973BFD
MRCTSAHQPPGLYALEGQPRILQCRKEIGHDGMHLDWLGTLRAGILPERYCWL